MGSLNTCLRCLYRGGHGPGISLYNVMRLLVSHGVCVERLLGASGEFSHRIWGFVDVRDPDAVRTALSAGKVCVASLPCSGCRHPPRRLVMLSVLSDTMMRCGC